MKEKSISHIPEFVYSEEKRKQYEESFRQANNDPEMFELAEEGLSDFVEIVKGFEYGRKDKSNQLWLSYFFFS